ncbi:hypothetical protein HNQ34_001992 [Anoxybacillus tepidamans]|uniref:Uncharacterized protein n=1 Tax=Anoxybacteroides tepidamans TaxID=265948 RepID=A0A7W8ISG6_9BACL|nr:hypothetical protein [Anoxybacillus tepidamans]MBB5324894.1 hypothetical protein [Anoxybacillus tepidamans]
MFLNEKEIVFVDQYLQHALAILYQGGFVSHEAHILYSRMISAVSEGYQAYLDYVKGR